MTQRGRKSAASLAVVGQVYGITRLAPADNLTHAQRVVWLALVNSRPAEWFGPEHAPMLQQYCRHKANADTLAERLNAFDPEWLGDEDGLKRYERLCSMMERETRAINALARSMRLTQQSTYDEKRARTLENQAKGRKPWQRYEDGDEG